MYSYLEPVSIFGYYMATGETLVAQRAVKHSTDTTIAAVSGTTDLAIGFLLDTTLREDQKVSVLESGRCQVEAGGACTRGQELKIDSVGRVVNSAGASGDVIVANCRQSATAAGDIIWVIVKPARKIA